MNWGLRITILYLAFVALIVTMVVMTMRQKEELIADDYYQQEINFQKQIDHTNAALSLSQQPVVKAGSGYVDLVLPEEFKGKSLNGTIQFIRPSDKTKDIAFRLNSDAVQHFDIGKFISGMYSVKIDWTSEGGSYFNETTLFIP